MDSQIRPSSPPPYEDISLSDLTLSAEDPAWTPACKPLLNGPSEAHPPPPPQNIPTTRPNQSPSSILSILPPEIIIKVLSLVIEPSSAAGAAILPTSKSFNKWGKDFLWRKMAIRSMDGLECLKRIWEAQSGFQGKFEKVVHLKITFAPTYDFYLKIINLQLIHQRFTNLIALSLSDRLLEGEHGLVLPEDDVQQQPLRALVTQLRPKKLAWDFLYISLTPFTPSNLANTPIPSETEYLIHDVEELIVNEADLQYLLDELVRGHHQRFNLISLTICEHHQSVIASIPPWLQATLEHASSFPRLIKITYVPHHPQDREKYSSELEKFKLRQEKLGFEILVTGRSEAEADRWYEN